MQERCQSLSLGVLGFINPEFPLHCSPLYFPIIFAVFTEAVTFHADSGIVGVGERKGRVALVLQSLNELFVKLLNYGFQT